MLRYYVRLGLLSIRANPALSTLMVAAIAVGIGACMTIVTINYIMSDNPIPHRSDVLYHVELDSWSPTNPYNEPNEPPPQVTYLDASALHGAGRADRQTVSYRASRVIEPDGDDARPFQVSARAATAGFFPMFDVPFHFGGGWDEVADRTRERVVVVGHDTNERLFGGADSTGRTLTLNGMPYRIVGVLDDWRPIPKFYDLNNNPYDDVEELFLPFSVAIADEVGSDGNTNCWKPVDEGGWEAFLGSECVWIQMWVELGSETRKQEYAAFLDAYVEEQKTLGRFPRPLNNRLADVEEWLDIREVVDEDVSVLLGLAILFLVVCLLNTIGLLLAKITRRARELSLRRALGASRAALFSQFIVEAGLIGIAGGLFGIVLTWAGLRGIENLFADYDFIDNLVRMDWVMVLFAVVLAVASALGAALYPTWRACRITPATHLRIQ